MDVRQPGCFLAVVGHHGDAIAAVLARTAVRTPDLGSTATTTQFTEQLLELL